MNINEEGKYYASMVRQFRTEYKSKNLHGFCKEQKVSYTKTVSYTHLRIFTKVLEAMINLIISLMTVMKMKSCLWQ